MTLKEKNGNPAYRRKIEHLFHNEFPAFITLSLTIVFLISLLK